MLKMVFGMIPFCCFFLISCSYSQKENETKYSKDQLSASALSSQDLSKEIDLSASSNYNFEVPTEVFVLEKKLSEISGLAFNLEDNNFITNNDEYGRAYYLDGTFKIVSEQKITKKGDFESIEKVGDDIVIAKNTGTLYFYNSTTAKTTSYETELGLRNNVEGMCFDSGTNSLLLACKGSPLDRSSGKNQEKSIYEFSLEEKKLLTKPFITLTDDHLSSQVHDDYRNKSKSKLKKLKNRVRHFSPSGIAIHPVTKSYFVLSAKSSLLIVLNRERQLEEIVFLDVNKNPQPEGICFDKESNLYISTEGRGHSGKVFKFDYND